MLPAAPAPAVLLTFREQVRSDAAQTLSYFREQDVGLKIISGDDPRTVTAVAREVGVDTDGGYDARQLPEDPEELADVMEHNTVFGRVTPAQKKDMVRALQRRGHVVAMTGDGVNDALALKEADIGIAMDSAAAATKAVSRLVLLDGRFDRLPGIVAEGRQVIANVERVSMLFLAKTAYAVILSVTFGALLWGFPFLPRQLSVTDGITIGIPAFFLALMPNTRRYQAGFLTRSLSFAVPAGLMIALAVFSINTYSLLTGQDTGPAARTGSVLVLTLIALWVLVVLSRPLNRWRILIIGVMYAALALVLTVPPLRDFFDFTMPWQEHLAMTALIALIGCLAIELLYWAHRRHLNTDPPPPTQEELTRAGARPTRRRTTSGRRHPKIGGGHQHPTRFPARSPRPVNKRPGTTNTKPPWPKDNAPLTSCGTGWEAGHSLETSSASCSSGPLSRPVRWPLKPRTHTLHTPEPPALHARRTQGRDSAHRR